ncbi:MAG: SLC13 family permease [Evtepia sp.]
MDGNIFAILIFIGLLVSLMTLRVAYCIQSTIAASLMLLFYLMKDSYLVPDMLNLDCFLRVEFWCLAENGAGVDWVTLLFLLGMMIMVEGMGESGFFRLICMKLAQFVHYNIIGLFFCFLFLSAFLSMFLAGITVILFLTSVTIELARLLKFDPVPFVLTEIFMANLGGAATMSGDPPNLIIGTAFHLGFRDFLVHNGLIVIAASILILPYFYFCFRRTLLDSERKRDKTLRYPNQVIRRWGAFAASVTIFALTACLLVSGFPIPLVAMITAVLTFLTTPSIKRILCRVDWNTLIFFAGLFIVVDGVERTGVLLCIAEQIAKLGDVSVMIPVILWVSALVSAFVDNIPFAATMVPVIRSIAAIQGIDVGSLAWSLSLGTDIGGNATPIGSSANLIGVAICKKEKHPISWRIYCKYAIPGTILTLFVCMIGMFLLH